MIQEIMTKFIIWPLRSRLSYLWWWSNLTVFCIVDNGNKMWMKWSQTVFSYNICFSWKIENVFNILCHMWHYFKIQVYNYQNRPFFLPHSLCLLRWSRMLGKLRQVSRAPSLLLAPHRNVFMLKQKQRIISVYNR